MPSSTMAYLEKTLRVLCPLSFMATVSGIPARIKLRTAVRRKS
jgi:hypothetical protein